MKNEHQRYLLGANSCEGFVSYFDKCFDFRDGWRCIIIKGGPGTGKSSFMKNIASAASKRGFDVQMCVCSSDPDSLDGIVIPDKKTALIDGTAPHVAEPVYPGACEQIINLGEFWNGRQLRENAAQIIKLTDKNKKLHKTASGYIAAAGELIYDNYKLSKSYTDLTAAETFGKKISQKLIPKQTDKQPHEWVRFIGGISPDKITAYPETVSRFYKNTVIIDDKYGAAANAVIEAVRKTALSRGYEIITLKNPFLPSTLTDHILIPKLSLAFVTENEYIKFNTDSRRIHARRFADVELMHSLRSRMLFNRKFARELFKEAANTLKSAKAVHDELESFYIDAMDFEAVSHLAEKTARDILN